MLLAASMCTHAIAITRRKIQNAEVLTQEETFAEIQQGEGFPENAETDSAKIMLLIMRTKASYDERVNERSKLGSKIKKEKRERKLRLNCLFYSAACRARDIFLPFSSRAKLT